MKRFSLLAVCVYALSTSTVFAQNLDFEAMPYGIDPLIDGQVTFPAEWSSATHVVNLLNTGTYHAENQLDWTAMSSHGNQTTYPGPTGFIMHDIWGYTTSELADYNTFELTLETQSLKVWIFANGDEPNDESWIGYSGLGYTDVDDRGFIVRKNGDPLTDKHWFPGDPEPGDPGWVWDDYYGFFGMAGFNDSAYDNGIPLSVNGEDNEVYELAIYGGIPESPVEPLGPFVRCQTTLTVGIIDPENGRPSQQQVSLISGSAHFNTPEPGQLGLLIIMLLSATGRFVLRR